MNELTIEMLEEVIKQLPPTPMPKGLKISPNDYSKMVEALDKVAQIKYTGTFIYPDEDMADGTYEFVM